MGVVDDYLAELEPGDRAAYEGIAAAVTRAAPDVEQAMSYGVPAFTLGGRPLLGVKASAKHLAIYPFSPSVVAAVAPKLSGFALSKGTIRFTAEQPVPDDVVVELVRLRRAELD